MQIVIERAAFSFSDHQAKKKLRESFRSIEDLKKDYEAMNLHVETDLEVMTKLIQTYNSTESTLEDKTLALRDLEYYVHQVGIWVDDERIYLIK